MKKTIAASVLVALALCLGVIFAFPNPSLSGSKRPLLAPFSSQHSASSSSASSSLSKPFASSSASHFCSSPYFAPSSSGAAESVSTPSSPYSPEEFVRRRLALMELVSSSSLSATANPAAGSSLPPSSTPGLTASTTTGMIQTTTPAPSVASTTAISATASTLASSAMSTANSNPSPSATSNADAPQASNPTAAVVSCSTAPSSRPPASTSASTIRTGSTAPNATAIAAIGTAGSSSPVTTIPAAPPAANTLIILFAAPSHTNPASHFRQDNDFYYFTGCEDADAILVMMPASKDALLFVPEKSAGEKSFEGPNSLDDPTAKDRLKVRSIMPLSSFDEFLARFASRPHPTFYLRLSPGDTVSEARYESALFQARRARNPYNAQLSLDQFRADRLRRLYPTARLEDVTPLIDSLRMIKSAEEIAVLRRNGQISAEAVKRAMLATRPAAYEYELEAAAIEMLLRHGCRGPAYTPIIGSGPNTCIMHYDRNNRQMQAGELVLMDFGGDLNYLTMDITRTWPVSGKFTAEQKKVYRAVLEVQKACIEAFKPGVTSKDVGDYVAHRLKEKGIDPTGLRGGLGHLVGMCVHDVQISPLVLKEGMVMAIEPALYFPEKNLGIRIEDTVLITKDGCEVLTAAVPKEIEDIEALLKKGT